MVRKKRANPFTMSVQEWSFYSSYDSFKETAYREGFRAQWDSAKTWEEASAVSRRASKRGRERGGILRAFRKGDPVPDAYPKKGQPLYWVANAFTTAGEKRQTESSKQRKPQKGRKYPKPAPGRYEYVPAWTRGVQIFAGSSVGGTWSRSAISLKDAMRNMLKSKR